MELHRRLAPIGAIGRNAELAAQEALFELGFPANALGHQDHAEKPANGSTASGQIAFLYRCRRTWITIRASLVDDRAWAWSRTNVTKSS